MQNASGVDFNNTIQWKLNREDLLNKHYVVSLVQNEAKFLDHISKNLSQNASQFLENAKNCNKTLPAYKIQQCKKKFSNPSDIENRQICLSQFGVNKTA